MLDLTKIMLTALNEDNTPYETYLIAYPATDNRTGRRIIQSPLNRPFWKIQEEGYCCLAMYYDGRRVARAYTVSGIIKMRSIIKRIYKGV